MDLVNRTLIEMNRGLTARDYGIARSTAQQEVTETTTFAVSLGIFDSELGFSSISHEVTVTP